MIFVGRIYGLSTNCQPYRCFLFGLEFDPPGSAGSWLWIFKNLPATLRRSAGSQAPCSDKGLGGKFSEEAEIVENIWGQSMLIVSECAVFETWYVVIRISYQLCIWCICMLYKTTQQLQPFPLSHTQGHACANSCAPPPEAHPNALPVQVLCMKYIKIYQNMIYPDNVTIYLYHLHTYIFHHHSTSTWIHPNHMTFSSD